MLNPFRRTYQSDELSQFRFLTGCPLFEELNNDELYLFLPHLYVRSYAQNEVVFFRGDPSQALYIVKNGLVELSIDVHDKIEHLNSTKVGESFGNNSLVTNTVRLYNASVVSDVCELYVLPQVNLQDIFESNPGVKAKLLEANNRLYYNYLKDLMRCYRQNFGFFELSQVKKSLI